MPFPLGKIYGNSIRGAGENQAVSRVLSSQLLTAIGLIIIIAMVILILFWSYVKKQNHWGRYLIGIGLIGAIIMGVALVSSYITKTEKEGIFKGANENMIKDIGKYEQTYSVDPNPALGGIVPESMKVNNQPNAMFIPSQNFNYETPTIVQIPSNFISGINPLNQNNQSNQSNQNNTVNNISPQTQNTQNQIFNQNQNQNQNQINQSQMNSTGGFQPENRPACPINSDDKFPIQQNQ